MQLIDPSTGLIIDDIVDSTVADVDAAMRAAAAAGDAWGRSLPSERSLVLFRLAEFGRPPCR